MSLVQYSCYENGAYRCFFTVIARLQWNESEQGESIDYTCSGDGEYKTKHADCLDDIREIM